MGTPTKKKYSLIEGTFNAQDAKEILLALLDNKIMFHQHRIFSHEERYGRPCEDSLARLKQLRVTKSELSEILKNCEDRDKTIHIHSEIQIEIK